MDSGFWTGVGIALLCSVLPLMIIFIGIENCIDAWRRK